MNEIIEYNKPLYAVITVLPHTSKKGNPAAKYIPVAGIIPNRHYVGLVVANSENFKFDEKYEVEIIELEPDDNGRRFRFSNKGIYKGNMLDAITAYGSPKIVSVDLTDAFTCLTGCE